MTPTEAGTCSRRAPRRCAAAGAPPGASPGPRAAVPCGRRTLRHRRRSPCAPTAPRAPAAMRRFRHGVRRDEAVGCWNGGPPPLPRIRCGKAALATVARTHQRTTTKRPLSAPHFHPRHGAEISSRIPLPTGGPTSGHRRRPPCRPLPPPPRCATTLPPPLRRREHYRLVTSPAMPIASTAGGSSYWSGDGKCTWRRP